LEDQKTPAGASRPTARKARHHDHVRAERKGVNSRPYIFRSATLKTKNHELLVRFSGAQCSNYKGIRVGFGRDPKSRQRDAGDFRNGGLGRGQALRIRCRKIDDKPDCGQWLKRQAPDSKPAHLDKPAQRVSRAYQQAPMRGFDVNAVIADEPREGRGAGLAPLDERERKPRLSGARRSADQYGAGTHQHGGRVDGRRRHCAVRGRSSNAALK
jgi:hypothetical protein